MTTLVKFLTACMFAVLVSAGAHAAQAPKAPAVGASSLIMTSGALSLPKVSRDQPSDVIQVRRRGRVGAGIAIGIGLGVLGAAAAARAAEHRYHERRYYEHRRYSRHQCRVWARDCDYGSRRACYLFDNNC
ncbi:MAG: hypothetical protein ACFCUN_12330 [Hyphomicrobiaceae bacterium]